MALIYRRAIIRPRVNPIPRVRSGHYFTAPVSVPTPVGIALIPSNTPAIADTALSGAVIGVVSTATSDTTPFAGVIGFAAPFQNAGGLLTLVGATLSLSRNLTASDVGVINFTVSATQNAVTVALSFQLFVGGVGGGLLVDSAGDIQAVDPAGDTLVVQ